MTLEPRCAADICIVRMEICEKMGNIYGYLNTVTPTCVEIHFLCLASCSKNLLLKE